MVVSTPLGDPSIAHAQRQTRHPRQHHLFLTLYHRFTGEQAEGYCRRTETHLADLLHRRSLHRTRQATDQDAL
jgi:hypothetical protein